MRIAVVGAGPAGVTAAKQALERGHDVVVYERHDDVGGIWYPGSHGAYPSVRMQSSRLSFPYSDFDPPVGVDFPALPEIHGYIRRYAGHFGVLPFVRFRSAVARVERNDGGWAVTTARETAERFDAVLVANGELWQPVLPSGMPDSDAPVRVLTAKDYREPEAFRGRRVLVVGGGVSGADIAAEVAATAASVDWSVRGRHLFLPRWCGDSYNDALFSYVGRLAVAEAGYERFIDRLTELMPEYMRKYRGTGLLPSSGHPNAVHVNDRIIDTVYEGRISVRPAFRRFEPGGAVEFVNGDVDSYDVVILCLGYALANYSFIEGFSAERLYEHHFLADDPTLAVINTPPRTDAYGTALPYFETIACWALNVLDGKVELPPVHEGLEWCRQEAARGGGVRHFDCWLETIRLGLLAGTVPDPCEHFTEYWTVVASAVTPTNLRAGRPEFRRAVCDDPAILDTFRVRILAALPDAALEGLVARGDISDAERAAAPQVPSHLVVQPWLPYASDTFLPHQSNSTPSLATRRHEGAPV